MTYIEFDDSLKLGNKLIDQEHAVLIDYINLLYKAVENETSVNIVAQVLDGLTVYTKTHFFVEEEMMRAFAFPDIKQHKATHEGFKLKLADLVFNYEKGDAQISNDTLNFLKDWLTEHILKVDRKLVDFLADKPL